jgi:hypothetical protein
MHSSTHRAQLNSTYSQSVGPGVLKAVLTPDQFERWEALLLQRTLDQVGHASVLLVSPDL